MTQPKKALGGRGSREWNPYPETTKPPEGERAEGRDMEFIELLAVMSAIQFFACRARLKPSEQDVLNAVLHHTVRYGRSSLLASHSYLAKFTGYGPKTHGAPLKGLHEKGFIEYKQGSPKKDASGHRHTQSKIRVRIPEGWEHFKDNSWVARFADGGDAPFESRPPSESKDLGEGDLQQGLESPDLPDVETGEGLETQDPKVSNLQTPRSRNSGPYGLESPDLEGLEIGVPNGESLERGVLRRGVLSEETQPDPPTAEASLGATDVAHSPDASTAEPSPRSSSRPEESPERTSGSNEGPHLTLVEARNPELSEGESSARAALDSLTRHVQDAGRKRLTVERCGEIISGCSNLIEADPEIEDQDLHYLLGLWAGDRALENANHLFSHMRRHKRHLSQVISDMEAQGGGEAEPDEWLKVGIVHGQQKRAVRLAERDADNTPPAKTSGFGSRRE